MNDQSATLKVQKRLAAEIIKQREAKRAKPVEAEAPQRLASPKEDAMEVRSPNVMVTD